MDFTLSIPCSKILPVLSATTAKLEATGGHMDKRINPFAGSAPKTDKGNDRAKAEEPPPQKNAGRINNCFKYHFHTTCDHECIPCKKRMKHFKGYKDNQTVLQCISCDNVLFVPREGTPACTEEKPVFIEDDCDAGLSPATS